MAIGDLRRRDLVALAAGFGASVTLWFARPRDWDKSIRASGSVSTTSPGDPRAINSPNTPVQLRIPAIGLSQPIRPLGLSSRGQIVPPTGTVQWYDRSVAPGTPGMAVLAGHVTSPRPDVFYRLAELTTGDTVSVVDRAGIVRVFRVDRTARIDKQTLATDATVWGRFSDPRLVLITCDRDSDVVDRDYSGNFVAWAAPADGTES